MQRILFIASILVLSALPLAAQEEGSSSGDRDFLIALSTPLFGYTYSNQEDIDDDGDDFVNFAGQLTSLDTAFGFGLTDMFYFMTRLGFGVNWTNGDAEHASLTVGVGPRISLEMSSLLLNFGGYLNYRYDDGIGLNYALVNAGFGYDNQWCHTLALEGYGGAEYLVTDNFAIGAKVSIAYFHMWGEARAGGLIAKSEYNGADFGVHLSSSIFF